ncbi:hypothetical protein ACSQ67_023459 [Phaseolus vulgaris]
MCSTSKVPLNTVIYSILIDALCKNSNIERAVSLMDDMKIKGVWDKKMLQKAFELVDRMIEDACSSDYITMEILTEWFNAVGEIEKLKCFVELKVGGVVVLLLLGLLFMRWMGLLGGKDPVYKGMEYAT